MKLTVVAIALLFFSTSTFSASKSKDVIVGIWDQEIGQVYSDKDSKIKNEVTDYILPAFQIKNGKWIAMEDDLAKQKWAVAFDGKFFGDCNTIKMDKILFPEFANLQKPEKDCSLPKYKNRKKLADGRTHRSFVVVSSSNFEDPDAWKPAKLDGKSLKALREAFHKKYPTAENCKKSQADQLEHPEPYEDSDIKIKKAYGSKKGDYLVNVAMEKWDCSELDGEVFEQQTFAVTASGEVYFMNIRMSLIDAGDYDHNGHSELVFEDNSDGGDDDNARGYSIWDSNFKQLAKRIRFLH